MKKRILDVGAAILGSPLVVFALYIATHPAVAASTMGPLARVSDRDAKVNLQPVQSEALLHQVATLPTFRA